MKTLHLTDEEFALNSNLVGMGVSQVAAQIASLQAKIQKAAQKDKPAEEKKPKGKGLHSA